jgi:GTP-binding protein HflX
MTERSRSSAASSSSARSAGSALDESARDAVATRAAVVAVQLPDVDDVAFSSSLTELGRLARTLGLEVVATITQRRKALHAASVVGSGKLLELQTLTGTPAAENEEEEEEDDDEEEDDEDEDEDDDAEDADEEEEEEDDGDQEPDADGEPEDDGEPDKDAAARPARAAAPPSVSPTVGAVLVDHEISPSQARNLEKATGAVVMDRTAVILEIFQRHARSRAAKAQVEIVRLQYLAPRLRESGKGRDRQRGGIGGKGAGESNLELDRRKLRDRIAELTRELGALSEEQRTQRARRRDMNRVALVGYTNAGKSTLMRALTGSEVYVADKLFATLDTTVRALTPAAHPRVLVSDTVGFIDKLPHGLVASFKSTLDEALEAGLLAQVVDASDPAFERQLQVTSEVLEEIGAGAVPRLVVFNKIDRVGDQAAQVAAAETLRARWPDAVIISARFPADVARLRESFIAFFGRDLVEGDVHVPYDRQKMRGEIFASCEVLGERYEDDGVVFRVRADQALLDRLRALPAEAAVSEP